MRILLDDEREKLNQHIVDAEKITGAQIVLAVVRRSDSYAELPWKAFALGASSAALLVLAAELFVYQWSSLSMVFAAVTLILGLGAVMALLTVFIPALARMFLSGHRAEVEVRQYTESLFLNRELFNTKERTGILLLVSLFERQVVILPDRGLRARMTEKTMQEIIMHITEHLARGEVHGALEKALERLKLSLGSAPGGTGGDELPDDIIEEEGQ